MHYFLPYSANTNMFVVMVSTLKLLKNSTSYENRACPFDFTSFSICLGDEYQ